jgi:hypothetical protein
MCVCVCVCKYVTVHHLFSRLFLSFVLLCLLPLRSVHILSVHPHRQGLSQVTDATRVAEFGA